MAIMQKNEVWRGTCEGYTYDGEGVVHIGGIVFFVPGLLEGEEADLGITAMKKNYGYARIIKLLKPSQHRVQPVCSVYRKCGGCQLMHMDEETQKHFKEDKVKGVFRQNAGMEITPEPILTEEHRTGYRNKVQVPVQVKDGKVLMGFYQPRSNTIVEFDRCWVQTDLSNAIIRDCHRWFEDLGCAKTMRFVLIKHAHMTDQVMVCLVVREYPFRNSDQLIQKLTAKYPEIVSILAVINRREDNVILDGKEITVWGKPYIEEELLGCRFRISARSFYQINPYATRILYSKAIEAAGLTGKETVIDLYCGTGTIGILASMHAKKVYGIEIVPDAVKDAEVNAAINHRDNIEFFTADAQAGAKKLIANHIKADVVIVDPPRKGCSEDTLKAILKIAPKRLVYVSCDPATLARDVAFMHENGYELKMVQPVDLFPGTLHVEDIALLLRTN